MNKEEKRKTLCGLKEQTVAKINKCDTQRINNVRDS